ncbi:MAG: DUF5709 domain-containing protein [Nocardioides sp.]|nr:DUF5709 domain-containing protein [Nocardioides sp.]
MSHEQLDPSDTLDDRGVEDYLDEGYSAPERYRGVNAKGVTAKEEVEGESLDDRIAQEEPEVWEAVDEDPPIEEIDDAEGREVGDARTGRLMAPDEGHLEDVDSEMVAEDEGIDGAAASAEEAAVHTIEE